MDAMKSRIVLVTSPQPLPPAAITGLAGHLGAETYSLKLLLKKPRPLLLGNAVDADRARQAVELLRGHSYEAYAFTEEDMNLPAPRTVRTLQFHRDHVRFVVNEKEMCLARWDIIFLLVKGCCRTRVRERTTRTVMDHETNIVATVHASERSRESASPKLDFYFFDGSAPIRIDCDRFSFAFLGDKLGPSDTQSLDTTIHYIRKLAPQIILDQNFESFRRGAGTLGRSRHGGSAALDSTEKQVDDDGPRFDVYSRLTFLINLRRAEQSV